MSFKPEFKVDGVWYDNAQRFATRKEAEQSAHSRFIRWTMPTDWRVSEAGEPINYQWHPEQGDVSLP
jgi:hypothetical protein